MASLPPLVFPEAPIKVSQELNNVAASLVPRILQKGIRCVAIDMDQTMAANHSFATGVPLRCTDFPTYVASVMPDFVALARALVAQKVPVAVATHSDHAEGPYYGLSLDDYLLGEDLVLLVLQYAVPDLVERFQIEAYCPDVHEEAAEEQNLYKRRHIRNIAQCYSIKESEVMLLDDSYAHSVSRLGDAHHENVVPIDPDSCGRYGMRLEHVMKWLAR